MYDGINSSSESDNSMRIGSGHFLSFNIDRYLNNKENFDISKIKQLLPMIEEVTRKGKSIDFIPHHLNQPWSHPTNKHHKPSLMCYNLM